MKKNTLIFTYTFFFNLFFQNELNAQKYTFFYSVVTSDCYGGAVINCNVEPEERIKSLEFIDIIGIDSCSRSFLVSYKGLNFNVSKKFVSDNDSIWKEFSKLTKIQREEYKKFAEFESNKKLEKQKIEFIETKNKFSNSGIAITDFGVFDESEYTDGTGFRVSFINLGKRTIKYIILNIIGYNAVDDPVPLSIYKNGNSFKCIGPIDPGETADYSSNYFWLEDYVEYCKIKSLKIQYMDGNIKIINDLNKILMSDSDKSILGY